jgi:serine protease Do
MQKKIFITLALLIYIAIGYAQYPVTQDGKSPFVQVIKDIRESVVNIQVEYEEEFGGTQQFDDFFKFFFPDQFRNPNQQPRKRQAMSMGSGFIFRRDKDDVYIITNNHVVEKGDKGEITVTLADKAKYTAEIIGLDSETDLAVIKISVAKHEAITSVPLGNSDEIDVGDWAIAIGNPFGQLGLERTVTVGVISATGRANLRFGQNSPLYQDYIQTDAAINPGNSGGPLVNIKGEVIGVNSAITSTSGGNVGIGFAIPVNIAKKVVNDLIDKGRVMRAYLGILPQEIDADLQKSLKLDQVSGVLVAKVEENTPAADSGIKRGDVIIAFNDAFVPNVAKFRIEVANSPIGKKIPVRIIRDNKEQTLRVTLVERTEDVAVSTSPQSVESSEWLGLQVESTQGEYAQRNNIDAEQGVVITKIEPRTPAGKSGLAVGDVIIEINNQTVKNTSDYQTYIEQAKEGKSDIILFYVKSNNNVFRFVPVNIEK